MDEITRYEPDCTGLEGWQVPDFEVNPNGGWVAYEDHAAEIARLRAELEEARGECEVLRGELDPRKIALRAVAWYFDQRDYQVSFAGEGAYYAHHVAARKKGMAPLVRPDNGGMHWPSPYMAIKACQHHAARAEGREDRRGERDEPR